VLWPVLNSRLPKNNSPAHCSGQKFFPLRFPSLMELLFKNGVGSRHPLIHALKFCITLTSPVRQMGNVGNSRDNIISQRWRRISPSVRYRFNRAFPGQSVTRKTGIVRYSTQIVSDRDLRIVDTVYPVFLVDATCNPRASNLVVGVTSRLHSLTFEWF